MLTVLDLSPGQSAVVTSVTASAAIRKRLFDMGIFPQATIQVARIAPFGGPVWIKVSDSQFALRSSEAKAVLVKEARVEPE